MFRALSLLNKESEEGFQSSPHSDYVVKQTMTFNKQYPNLYPVGTNPSNLQNSSAGLASWDPNTRQSSLRDIDVAKYATGIQVSQELLNSHQRCKTATLDDLVNTESFDKKLRCGWIYENGQPATSEGALGTRSGPAGFVQTPKGKWYWNLEDAKKQVLSDRCAAMTSCKDVGSTNFQSCGYSTKRGIGIPVDTRGGALYPNDPRLSAPSGSIVTNPNQCPPPPAAGSPQYELQRSRDLCTPLPNGQLSRDCMLQQVTAAGCKDTGTLYLSLLNEAVPSNYGAGLQNKASFKKYQELATQPILDTILRDGRTSVQDALGNFKTLATAASKVEMTALNFAARDLCLKQGTMEEYDFCDELKDGSPAPFALECLQKHFLKNGGQATGTEYPTERNKALWDQLGTWKAVREKVDRLKAALRAADEGVQRRALAAFLGIRRESYAPKQIGRIPGIETFWFNSGNNTFLGRRLFGEGRADFPRFSQVGGEVENTGLADQVEYLSLVNLRPLTTQSIRLRLETDDGALYSKNKRFNPLTSQGQNIDTGDMIGSKGPQTKCWDLVAGGPNYINGWWQEAFGVAHSQIFYSPCNQVSWQKIPAEWMTLTQEPDAPMLSWQEDDSGAGFAERRIPNFFELVLSATDLLTNTNAELPYKKVLKMSANSLGVVSRNLGMNSWRTLSVSFLAGGGLNASTGARTLLSLGPLTITMNGRNVTFSWSSATLTASQTFNGLINAGPNYLVVNMRSDFESRYPNRITFAVGTYSMWKNGTINIQSTSPNVATFTTANNAALYNKTDSAEFVLGEKSRTKTAEVGIGSIRLFDYELDTDDILRDIKNEWQMEYF
jgi:hypothetical protein